mmetsp:Transcript_16305/g.52190  ORF Transcript_16305/g.52190 Transcript_16305/m.52190 type:complete len:217 (-) Transcript_16305:50-700(-)
MPSGLLAHDLSPGGVQLRANGAHGALGHLPLCTHLLDRAGHALRGNGPPPADEGGPCSRGERPTVAGGSQGGCRLLQEADRTQGCLPLLRDRGRPLAEANADEPDGHATPEQSNLDRPAHVAGQERLSPAPQAAATPRGVQPPAQSRTEQPIGCPGISGAESPAQRLVHPPCSLPLKAARHLHLGLQLQRPPLRLLLRGCRPRTPRPEGPMRPGSC